MGRVAGTAWAEQRTRSRGRAELLWDTSHGPFPADASNVPIPVGLLGVAPTPRLILYPSLWTRHPQAKQRRSA